jgi:hypothetical protein
MGILVSVHQPQVFHSIHLLSRIIRSNVHVVMDLAQINRKVGMATYLLGRRDEDPDRSPISMKVPVSGGNRVSCLEAKIGVDDGWVDKHLGMFDHLYSRATHYQSTRRQLALCLTEWRGASFASFGTMCLRFAFGAMGLENPPTVFKESSLRMPVVGEDGTDRIAGLVQTVYGTGYYCGRPEDRPYLDEDRLRARGIKTHAQDFVPPPDGNLSWVHVLAKEGRQGLQAALIAGPRDKATDRVLHFAP